MSKCKGGRDLGQYTCWVLAKREPMCNDDLRKKTCFARRKNQNLSLRSVSLFASTQKVHWPRSQPPLHVDIGNVSKFTWKFFSSTWRLLSPALLEPRRSPQVCRVKITFTELLMNCFVFTTKNSMKCVVNWIPLRIRVRLRNTQPHLNH